MIPLDSAAALPLSRSTASSPERIEHAARELETQFAHMMIKSMRSASFGDPLGGDSTYRDMYDQQLAKELAKGRGLGLAPMITRQLQQTSGATAAPSAPVGGLPLPAAPASHRPLPAAAAPLMPLPATGGLALAPSRSGVSLQAMALPPLPMNGAAAAGRLQASAASAYANANATGRGAGATSPAQCDPDAQVDCSSPEAFVRSIWPLAQKTAESLGVPAKALVAQAALETGWGRHLAADDTRVSNNLFGIKATGWAGDRVRSGTHEYVDGQLRTGPASFRAYGSVAESFDDYARLLRGSRYSGARAAGNDVDGFANALQRAGYATDPGYADKIRSIANGETLQRALAALPLPTRG